MAQYICPGTSFSESLSSLKKIDIRTHKRATPLA